MRLMVFCANHSVLRKAFLDDTIAAGSPAPLYVITHLAPRFKSATIFLEHGINKELEDSLELPGSVRLIKGPSNKILSLIWQFVCGFYISVLCFSEKKVYYGYGYNSVVSYYLSKLFRGTSVARFYGTFLGQHVVEDKVSVKGMSAKRLWEFFAFSRHHDLIVCTNDGTDSFVVRDLIHGQKERVRILLNGLDVPEVVSCYLPPCIRDARFRFVSVSRLANWKRIDLCLSFYAGFVARYPDVSSSLVIVGDGEALSELKSYAKKLGIAEKVYFTGGLSREEIFDVLNQTSYFLSLYEAGNIGNTLIEALYVGLLPILRDTGVTGRVMTSGVNAYILPGPEEELMTAMDDCYELIYKGEHDNLLEGVSKFSKEHIFTWDKRIEHEYHMIIEVQSTR